MGSASLGKQGLFAKLGSSILCENRPWNIFLLTINVTAVIPIASKMRPENDAHVCRRCKSTKKREALERDKDIMFDP